jgi:two-component system sensor histidine kinase CreC
MHERRIFNMNLPLRVLLGYFMVLGLAAFFVLRIFVNEVRPSVRETIEEVMVDSANMLAVLAADDLKSGHIADGAFAKNVEAYRHRTIDAPIWHFHKQSLDFRVLVTDDKGIVRLDSDHIAEGQDYSRWNDVYKTLLGEYGARATRTDPGDDRTNVFNVAAPITDDGKIIGHRSPAHLCARRGGRQARHAPHGRRQAAQRTGPGHGRDARRARR